MGGMMLAVATATIDREETTERLRQLLLKSN